MVKEEDRAKVGEVKGNMKSLINAKDMPTPAFAGSQFLKAHYDSMMPAEKFHTPTLESHKCGGGSGQCRAQSRKWCRGSVGVDRRR